MEYKITNMKTKQPFALCTDAILIYIPKGSKELKSKKEDLLGLKTYVKYI